MKEDTLFPNLRRAMIAAPLTCEGCRHESNMVIIVASGPHSKALCKKCGRYLKFLKAGDIIPVRKPGEDRKGSVRDFYVVWAIKDSLCVPALAPYIESEALAEVVRLRSMGYKAGMDFIASDLKRVKRGEA